MQHTALMVSSPVVQGSPLSSGSVPHSFSLSAKMRHVRNGGYSGSISGKCLYYKDIWRDVWQVQYACYLPSYFVEKCTRVDVASDRYLPDSIKRHKPEGCLRRGPRRGIRRNVESSWEQRIGD